jgi:hypothetical protein
MTNHTAPIMIRPGYADDALAIARLATLDSASTDPSAPLLLAEVDGVLRAALSLRDGAAIADPFFPSAELVELLRTYARTIAAPPDRRRRSHRLSALRALRGVGRPAAISPSRSGR